ncbi:MAG TPA: diguanylate cyclase, partial [Pyrinomonadaceae bacterium]|nr:diguanylate cyclase [Pyrinomonadaceae bacterium]
QERHVLRANPNASPVERPLLTRESRPKSLCSNLSLQKMSRSRINQTYVWIVIAAGIAVMVFSAGHLSPKQIDIRFLLLALVTVCIGPRLSIQIPRVKAHISVSDTFIFLALLLFGGEAAILLATLEALCSSVHIGSKARTHLFNACVMACATFLTVWTLRLSFGETVTWHDVYSPNYLVALCVMAVVQYLGNSILVATSAALKADEPLWPTWRKNFLWTSITYLAGASAAGIIARFIGNVGFFAFSATIPIIAILYFTYWTYMKNVEGAATQAEQARLHVEELNRHLAEQKRIGKALRETEAHFRNAFDYAAIGMALVSPQGAWLRVNRSLCELIGYSEDELLASNFQAVTHTDDVDNDLANLYRLMQGETPHFQVEKRYVHKFGQVVWALNSVSLVRDADDNAVHFIFQIQDITERKRAEAALQSLSLVDELTGLYNRRGFLAVTEQHLAAIQRTEKIPVIVYADLDGLKGINDSLGHHEGDRALVKTAELFKETCRSSDIIARLGGDEFVVLAAIGPEESVESLMLRLQEKFSASNSVRNRLYDLSISIGVAHFDAEQDCSVVELMARADRAMYEDKRRKRSRDVIAPEFARPRIEAVA